MGDPYERVDNQPAVGNELQDVVEAAGASPTACCVATVIATNASPSVFVRSRPTRFSAACAAGRRRSEWRW
ncbi:hypothetical protein ABIE67_003160 [Streptomyces sp. V4I8]